MEQKFYICKHCGNIIVKIKDSSVPVVCCGEPMSEIVPGVTDAAVERIIEQSFDPAYGARPINRFIQSHIETLIARKLIAEDVAPDSTITVGLDADGAFTASVSAIVPAEEQNG